MTVAKTKLRSRLEIRGILQVILSPIMPRWGWLVKKKKHRANYKSYSQRNGALYLCFYLFLHQSVKYCLMYRQSVVQIRLRWLP